MDGRSEIYIQRTLEKFCHGGVQRPRCPYCSTERRREERVSWVLRRVKEAV